MRFRLWLQVAFAAAVLAFPASSWGQFQPPTDEELKMTAEPKAPGAAAIYLYREETVDDNLHFHSFYARIKVLTEKGKELATVGVPYPKGAFKVEDVKARTIHSDGTVIPLDVKPSDLVEHKGTGVQINKMVFTLPSVEVGSILEYRWQLRYGDETLSSPEWEVQQEYFVRKAHYSFLPFAYLHRVVNSRGEAASKLLYSSMLPEGVKVNYEASGRYTLDVTDVAPVPDEEYMPPMAALMESVQFYYTGYSTKEDFWKHEGERWSKQMDHFAGETKTLKDAVATIVAPADSEDVKAHKIYDAVMALENTDYTRRKSESELKELHLKEAKDAEDVWTRKSGTSDEIALLYLAMARIAGLKTYAMTVCDRNRDIFNPYFLSLSQFQDVLVVVTIDGKETPLDPGTKFADFGELDWRHSLVSSLRQSEKGPELSGTPGNSYKQASTLRTGYLTIDRDGSITGTIRITMNGPAALRWRETAVENDEDEVKKRFNEELRRMVPDGVDAELDHFLALDDYHSVLMAIVKVSGNMGTATGKRVFLPGVFFESRAKHPFVAEEKRLTPVDMEYADTVSDEVTYHLPDTFAVESAPPDSSIPWPGHAAFQLKSVAKKNDITVARTFARAFALLEPKDYSSLRDFYQKVATADQQQLVLKVAPANGGN
ncbi:DUF3857 domain-containing protein [Acidicapsa acidisoli]|uniref:DUF3857 domain-containing protein n=1 Tax=Acidicapsa acidisoli TaxID=1615681 RepID=UPI0021E01291|nr:DUF3857 domain-containing protein [Acidicapsa acidisoli]